MAITQLISSPNGEISHNDVREKVNEVITGNNNSIKGIEYDFVYVNNSPVQTNDTDTGVVAANLPAGSLLIITCLFQVDTNNTLYAINTRTENDLALIQTDIHQLRSAEPVTGSGDVAFSSWVDGTTGTYHYSLDVDGAGKTLISTSAAVKKSNYEVV